MITVHQRYRQTDGKTDRQLNGNTALCYASRGKKWSRRFDAKMHHRPIMHQILHYKTARNDSSARAYVCSLPVMFFHREISELRELPRPIAAKLGQRWICGSGHWTMQERSNRHWVISARRHIRSSQNLTHARVDSLLRYQLTVVCFIMP